MLRKSFQPLNVLGWAGVTILPIERLLIIAVQIVAHIRAQYLAVSVVETYSAGNSAVVAMAALPSVDDIGDDAEARQAARRGVVA